MRRSVWITGLVFVAVGELPVLREFRLGQFWVQWFFSVGLFWWAVGAGLAWLVGRFVRRKPAGMTEAEWKRERNLGRR